MALYLGNSEKLKITLSNGKYLLNIPSSTPITNSVRLLSFDNYILKDSNGLYLTVTPITNSVRLLSFDNYILKDFDGLYLTVKEDK